MSEKNVPQAEFDPKDILTPAELSRRLKVSLQFLYDQTRKTSANRLPVIRVGRLLRYHWPSVMSWLQMRSQKGRAA